ncbi:hypothetical protein LSAT2_008095 [Lamellibrachia satsuma]|nr:hypothetical protein LSAT2_008095 [Lamellibrachia satsuma]
MRKTKTRFAKRRQPANGIRYNQVIKMKAIVLVVAICLLLSANSDGIPMESTCARTCRFDFRKCGIACIEKKRTIEEDKECDDSAINYLAGEDTYCVTGDAYARITSASGCARSLLGKERLLATATPPSDWTRIEVDRRKGLRTSIRLRAHIQERSAPYRP